MSSTVTRPRPGQLAQQGQRAGALLRHQALPHVLLQGARHAERHLAKPALEGVVAGPAVGLHVPGELAGLGAGVGAQLALVRLLPGVGPPVHRQVRAVLEHFPTKLAGVLPPAPDQLLPRARVEDGVKATLLGQGFDGGGFHGRQLHTRRQRRQRDVLQGGAPPAAPGLAAAPPQRGRAREVLNAGHPEAGEQVLLLAAEDGGGVRGGEQRGLGTLAPAAPATHLQLVLELPDVVVNILLVPRVSILLQRLPVGLLEKIFLNISHFLKIYSNQLT